MYVVSPHLLPPPTWIVLQTFSEQQIAKNLAAILRHDHLLPLAAVIFERQNHREIRGYEGGLRNGSDHVLRRRDLSLKFN